jgi:hypothetical protein
MKQFWNHDVSTSMVITLGKHNVITTAAGSKFRAHDYYYSALRSAPTPAVVTAEQVKTLNEAKAAEALRMAHHFRVDKL